MGESGSSRIKLTREQTEVIGQSGVNRHANLDPMIAAFALEIRNEHGGQVVDDLTDLILGSISEVKVAFDWP